MQKIERINIMEKIIIDKHKSEYEIRILTNEDNYKMKIINKINDLWVKEDIKFLNNTLTTEYSPDGLPTTFVVTKNAKLVGFCTILRVDVRFREDIYPWFGNCFIYEKYRRKGVMNAMQEYVCNYAKSKGYSQLYLWSKNKDLFSKVGWRYLEDIKIDKKEIAHLFVRDL